MGSKIGNKERVVTPAPNACIEIRGARQNNLKNLTLELPKAKTYDAVFMEAVMRPPDRSRVHTYPGPKDR